MLYRGIHNQRFCLHIVHGEALLDARAYVERVNFDNQDWGQGGFIWLPVQHTISTYWRGKTSFLTRVVGTFVFLMLNLTFAEVSLLLRVSWVHGCVQA